MSEAKNSPTPRNQCCEVHTHTHTFTDRHIHTSKKKTIRISQRRNCLNVDTYDHIILKAPVPDKLKSLAYWEARYTEEQENWWPGKTEGLVKLRGLENSGATYIEELSKATTSLFSIYMGDHLVIAITVSNLMLMWVTVFTHRHDVGM